MKPRQQRMLAVGLAALGIAIAAGLTLRAFQDNMNLFVEVSDVVAGNHPTERNFRIGGLVVGGSMQREEGSLLVSFEVTDTACTLPVQYTGVLPDLFREGQGIVAHGRLDDGGVFVADKILAKHDENYMAPEVADSLSKHQQDIQDAAVKGAVECGSSAS
ncbi:MAG: cytochrome c maturation protein CcmE [Gammaproteobacteria bacterium]|nr:cytochrome c maturation protein CcmE [Gammaproteobacteria bacterium]